MRLTDYLHGGAQRETPLNFEKILLEVRDNVTRLCAQFESFSTNNAEKHGACVKRHEATCTKIRETKDEGKKDLNHFKEQHGREITELRNKQSGDITGVHDKIERHTFGGIRFVGAIVGIVVAAGIGITSLIIVLKSL